MNRKLYTLIGIAITSLGIGFSSCSDYLNVEKNFNDMQSEQKIFTDRNYTMQWLSYCYSRLLGDNVEVGHSKFCPQNFADDQVFTETYDRYKAYKLGEIGYGYDNGYDGYYQNSWKWSYAAIYQATVLINKVDQNTAFTEEEVLDIKGQARFLRAYFYWLLLKRYGPIPLMPASGVDFVDKTGRKLIPQKYSEEKWAKAAAAARDVIEGNWYKLYTAKFREEQVEGDYANPKTIVPPYHPVYSKANFPDGWKDIDPLESYRSVFNGEVNFFNNPEMIFSRVINNGAELHPDLGDFSDVLDMVRHQMPASLGGWNIHSMTMKQCDAYDMADGTAFDRKKCLKGFAGPENKKDRPYDNLEDGVWMGYANREPRFYASVGYNGARWNCTSATGDGSEVVKNQQVWYYRGSKDGRSNNSERWLATGIGIKKYIHPSDCYVNNGTALPKVEPALRYADILISYAEALNNIEEGNNYQIESWDGNTTYTVRRDINEMRRGMKPVRMRAGVPDFPDDIYNNRKLFFTRVVHERQVEFFNESQRYYDVRRWKIAPEHEGAQIYGCNVMVDEANREMFYTPVRVSGVQTAFSRKQYFWPVNYDELQRNKNMTQAPGWQDYD